MSTTPTNPVVEVLIDGEWVDIAADCRLDSAHSGGGIRIKRGRPNESPAGEPTEVDFVLNNGESKVASTLGQRGCYAPKNATGPYYGKLTRNLPVRIGMNRVYDQFTRTAANNWWGTTPNWTDTTNVVHTGHQWNLSGLASNFDLTGTAATIQAATGYQAGTFGTYADVDITTKVRVSNRTSEFGIVLRMEGVTPTQADGGFESSLGPWQSFDSTLVRSTAQSRFGSASALMTVVGSPSNAYMRPTLGNGADVVAGNSYKIRSWVRLSITGNVRLSWDWYDSGVNYLSSSYSGNIAVTANSWAVVEYTATAPANAVFGYYGPGFAASPAAGTAMYVDNLHYQQTDPLSYYTAYVTPAGTDLIRIGRVSPGSGTALSSNMPFQIVANTDYWMRAQANAYRFRVKIWADGDDEPSTWNRTRVDTNTPANTEIALAGEVGLFAKDGTALVTFAEIKVDQWRAHAEIVKLPTRFDLALTDQWVPVQARGIRRRLGQGRKALDSAITRHLGKYSPTHMWMPLEGGVSNNRVPNLAPGAPDGIVQFITINEPEATGANALPGISGYAHFDEVTSRVRATIRNYTHAGKDSVFCIFRFDASPASTTNVFTWTTTGTARTWRAWMLATGEMNIVAYDSTGAVLQSATQLLWGFADHPVGCWISCTLYLQNSGGNIVWAFNYHRPGGGGAFYTINGSFAGSHGRFTGFVATSYTALHAVGGLSLAQAFHYAGDLPFVTADFANAAAAYQGEQSQAREIRLLGEHGIKAETYNPSGGKELGPQRPNKLLDLLDECAEAEHGSLIEDRTDFAIDLMNRDMTYRARVLELDIEAGHLTAPLDPDPDDQGLRNDVTVRKLDGFSARSVQETGPNNVNQPEADPDGVGTYDEGPELNLGNNGDVQPAANWRRSHGVLEDPRYPSFTMDLTSTAFQNDPALAAVAASLDTGRMVSILNTQVEADPTLTLIQSYTEFIDQFDWDLTFVGTPGTIEKHIGTVGYTTRVSPSNATVQATFLSGTDTALKSQGTLWVPTSTDPDVAGFDILVSGVRLRVVSIAGSSAPQTITVLQAPVNGVVKTISVGEKIELYDPWRVAW